MVTKYSRGLQRLKNGAIIGFNLTFNKEGKTKMLNEYEFCFEAECGAELGTIEASNLAEATAILKRLFPNDHGADGIWVNADGFTIGSINW